MLAPLAQRPERGLDPSLRSELALNEVKGQALRDAEQQVAG